jgi:mRNA-degrading endonuclease toxin of MazEF toxin-antitoxin module/antitoxin component of MazEF toxin-antitoxin module
MSQAILKWGNSLAFRIPAAIAKQMEIAEGAEVEFRVDGKCLVIERATEVPTFTRKDLVKALRRARKGLVELGSARGKEILWVALLEGDLIEVDADGAAGHEQQGRRPVLVVSVNALQSALGLAMVCAVTTHGGRAESARNDLEVSIPQGLPVKGVILPHQLRTIDCRARNAKKLGAVPRTTLQATRARLKTLLGL